MTPLTTKAAEVLAGLVAIEHDPHDHSREYIPLPGGWEIQTKGAGSSYRLLDKKTSERHLILTGKDWMGLQAFFTRFAREVFEASRQVPEPASLSPGSTGEAEGCSPISDEPLEALSHARTTAANDDTSKPGTVERKRHCQRLAAMQSATAEIVKLRALLSAAGER
jgi:hypothetical protein